ncbi:hypothetical protein NBRC110019_01090 [Neptunitalea chrysea]|uniref:Uncharacterized protein n=1 Tax=Neptunitalea chrysea TaxID=1647581 RepID=A0A9W6B2T0_9FLAO|nr:hypothetical protein NBRC110019_01090 [Neptunitalea chrysea]
MAPKPNTAAIRAITINVIDHLNIIYFLFNYCTVNLKPIGWGDLILKVFNIFLKINVKPLSMC